MCSAAASSELGPAAGWRVRGGGAGATPLYTDNLQRGYRVDGSNSQHGERDGTGGGRCGRLKPRTGTNTGTSTGAPPQARLSLNEQRGRTVRTPAAAHTMFYMCPPAYYPLALPGLFVERTVGGANEGPTCGACLLGSSQSAPPIILGSSLCPRPGYWRCGKLPRCRYAVVYAPKGLSLIESRRVMSVPPQGSALLRECSLHRDRDRCACRPVGA